jgi:hypothetical protein
VQFTTKSGPSIIFIFFTIFHCIDSQPSYIAHTSVLEADGALAAKKALFSTRPEAALRSRSTRGSEAAKAVDFGPCLRNCCKREFTRAHAGVRRIPWSVTPA